MSGRTASSPPDQGTLGPYLTRGSPNPAPCSSPAPTVHLGATDKDHRVGRGLSQAMMILMA